MICFRVERDWLFSICLKLGNTEAKTKISVAYKKRVLGLHIQMQVKIKKLLDNNNLNRWSKFSWSTFISLYYFSLCMGLKILIFRWCCFNVTHKKFQLTLSAKMYRLFTYDAMRRERGVLSNFGLFCMFGQSLLFFLLWARGVKFIYFLADVICEWSLTNKNKMQFTLDHPNSEGDKVIIVADKNIVTNKNIVWVSEISSYPVWLSIGGRVQLIKCFNNGFNSVRLMEHSS